MLEDKMGYAGLIVKGTRLCNLRCNYCHDWRIGRDQTMPFDVLATLVARVLQDDSHDMVDFIWHGGETTMLPITFYEKAVFLQSRFRRPGQLVTNVIQTNGTRLTPKWVKFLRENHFGIGLSLDGPPEIHDQYRRYASGRPSFFDVGRGIDLLKDQRVPFSILMVIDDAALRAGADRIFEFFLEKKIKSYSLLYVKPINQPNVPPGTLTSSYMNPTQMTAFLMRLYDRWCEHGDPEIRIRELEGLRKQIIGQCSGDCTLAGRCFGKFFIIEPNGDVAHCDLFLGDDQYVFGNILSSDFSAFRQSSKFALLQAENERALNAMRLCSEFAVCNGGCPHDRYLSIRHNPSHRVDCCGLQDLIRHIRGHLDQAPHRSASKKKALTH
jgi:uncharacterized protein